MQCNEQTSAVLLFTAWLSRPGKDSPKPLTPTEWGRFAHHLKARKLAPEEFLRVRDPGDLLEGWSDKRIDAERIRRLLGRSGALGLALEKWERAGLWVMIRSDPDYPSRLKQHLRRDAPPVLFGAGERGLLAKGGLAVVGSRGLDQKQLEFARALGRSAAEQGFSVVSGGARGADDAAMTGALDAEGTVVGVLADSLLRAATSSKFHTALINRNLALLSPFNPETGFDVGNAMARNKYIYCLADAAVVVAATESRGGTWSGAVENLKRGWVPLWIRKDEGAGGNAALVQAGGSWLPEGAIEVADLMQEPASRSPGIAESAEPEEVRDNEADDQAHPDEANSQISASAPRQAEASGVEAARVANEQAAADTEPAPASTYDRFLPKLQEVLAGSPSSLEELRETFDLGNRQLTTWLSRALKEGHIEKSGRPARYQVSSVQQQSLDF